MTGLPKRPPGATKRYVLDANVFIAAWHNYYPIDVYPGFWNCLERSLQQGAMLSIDKVRSEIKSPVEINEWITGRCNNAFVSTKTNEIAMEFSKLQQWVQDNPQFQSAAKEGFAKIADGWLAAYALAHDCVLVTNEVYDPNAKRRVPLPNLCKEFGIEYCNTVEMLRQLEVRFDLRSPS